MVCRGGDWLFRQGDPGDELYLLVRGRLQVWIDAPEPGAIAEALRSVLADPAARQSAHDAGMEWRERLATGHVADRCLAWYREALDE